jgi:hypothetical protein
MLNLTPEDRTLLLPNANPPRLGATPEGKKELLGFQTGVRESAQSWRELLIDIKQRRLATSPAL